MFFKASRFECRKTIFDATKVTYNTYSCSMSGMSREMIKMEGRDSAECQNWEYKDIIGVNGIVFKLENDKRGIESSSSKRKKGENVGRKKRDAGGFRSDFF